MMEAVMANTEFGVNHSLTNKLFSKQLANEAIRQTYIGRFIGKGKDALIQEHVDLKKGAGDKITYGLRVQLQGDGVQGDSTLEGNEEALQFYNDSIVVNQLRHAVRINGKLTEQRVPYPLRTEAKDGLRDWWADRMDVSFFNHICGNTVQTDTRFTGNNTVTAPTSNRKILAGTGNSNDEDLGSSDTFTLELLDYAREKAETASTAESTGSVIRPIRMMGDDYYVAFLHDYQVTDLRTGTGTGQWQDIQKAAMQGGDVGKNPIFTGALGVYNGIILHKAKRVTQGVNSSSGAAIDTVRRAVLCGAQSAAIAFGGSSNASKYDWNEEMFDYGNQFGVEAGSIFGIKKNRFSPESGSANVEDFGSIVISTYASAHA
jgi:N4-gp56 family major capsid protein